MSKDAEPKGLRRGLFLVFFLFFVLLGHGYIENPDAEVEYQTARSLVLRGGAGLSAAPGPAAATQPRAH